MNDSSNSIRLDAADPELLEKVVDHYTQRLREGQEPSIASYQQRFPQHGEEIRELLSSVAMIEQLKSETNRPQQTQQHRLLDRVSQLTEVGPYRLLREAGRGGMGVVFEAVHESLGRRVAIKVMPTPLVEAEKYIARFKREAQSAARLHHTNIVSVFGVGESDGFHYYVMDFVDGQCLAQTIASLHKSTNPSRQPHKLPRPKLIIAHHRMPPAVVIPFGLFHTPRYRKRNLHPKVSLTDCRDRETNVFIVGRLTWGRTLLTRWPMLTIPTSCIGISSQPT